MKRNWADVLAKEFLDSLDVQDLDDYAKQDELAAMFRKAYEAGICDDPVLARLFIAGAFLLGFMVALVVFT